MVSQKGPENLPVLSSLILVFGTGTIEKHAKKGVFSFIISGKKNCCWVYEYFDKFKLQTKK
jgi:hypothetical protein